MKNHKIQSWSNSKTNRALKNCHQFSHPPSQRSHIHTINYFKTSVEKGFCENKRQHIGVEARRLSACGSVNRAWFNDSFFLKQLTESGEEKIEVQNHHQMEQEGLYEAPREGLYSLKIQNTTNCSSGTYKCTLEGPEGQRNQSGTVTLKVTGEVVCCTCFLLAKWQNTCALSIFVKIDPLRQSLSQKLWSTSVAES